MPSSAMYTHKIALTEQGVNIREETKRSTYEKRQISLLDSSA